MPDSREWSPGQLINAKVDLVLANDITAPIAIEEFREVGATQVFDPAKIVLVPDHFVPNKDIKSAQQCQLMREFAKDLQLPHYFEVGETGIEHALLPGAGPGPSRRPGHRGRQPHLHLWGPRGLCHGRGIHGYRRGHDHRRGLVPGPGNDQDHLSRQAAPLGGRERPDPLHHRSDRRGRSPVQGHGIHRRGHRQPSHGQPPHHVQHGHRGRGEERDHRPRTRSPRSTWKSRAKRPYKFFHSDAEAKYSQVLDIDVTRIEPQVAFPHLPSNVRPISAVGNVPIDQAVIGSCTNGRLDDLRVAARVLKGRKRAPFVRLIIIPATQEIYRQAMKEGLFDIFMDAHAVISTPTCGPCLGGYMGILAKGERAVSTTNRNFVGRMGHPESEVYLANPAVAAASAVLGRLGGPEELGVA